MWQSHDFLNLKWYYATSNYSENLIITNEIFWDRRNKRIFYIIKCIGWRLFCLILKGFRWIKKVLLMIIIYII
jgi:hypothetical protein